jgi:D-alanyl-D-alanine endopeptidase (penicillin-binding protein 7)
VAAMNAKARAPGMRSTHDVEPTGLSSENVSSPEDLTKLVIAAERHPLIPRFNEPCRCFRMTSSRRLAM